MDMASDLFFFSSDIFMLAGGQTKL